jgi:hypothetical protein
MSAITTFLSVLFVVMFLAAVLSKGALKGPDAFVLRWTVISLGIVFSALVAWLRWRLGQPRERRSLASGQRPTTRADTPLATRIDPTPANARRRDVAAVSPHIVSASRQAIVFHQHVPPRHDRTLSFFGGAPVAPPQFRWPRASGAQSKPLSFLMQIDCGAIPGSARLGLLPDHGVLYFFLDLAWTPPDLYRVLYEQDGGGDWITIQAPDDLGPAFGDDAVHVWKWTQSPADCPRLLPRWTFDPVIIDVPAPVRDQDEEDGDGPLLWPGEKATAAALRAAQGGEVLFTGFTVKDLVDHDGGLHRPFANYPHDWRAIQICSGLLFERVRETKRLPSTWALRELSESERDAAVTRIRDEARTWYDRAASHAPFTAVPQTESDRFWSWLSDKSWLVRFVIGDAVTMSIEATMVNSAEAAARVPPDVARRVLDRHALAVRHEDRLFANTPDRMLAAPVDVQGHQWDRAKTHLLLLELSSNEGLGHHFGEGVYQFWITPDDLRGRRFDKVELTADAY